MNRNTGLVAGLVAVVALVGFSNRSNRSPENSQNATSEKSPAPSAKAQSTSEERTSAGSLRFLPCAEIRKRLARFVDDHHGATPAESWMLPDSCYEKGESPARPKQVFSFPDVQFAIAVVPNTHLPLLFDRLVEAIQQAVQDDDYSYDASWFPWDAAREGYNLLKDQLAEEELQKIRQAQPGVIVFRGPLKDEKGRRSQPYEHGWVIFLVAEQPTGGVKDDEFENAIAWIDDLEFPSARQQLRILGPTFSGSLPSLQRVLERWEHNERNLPGSSHRRIQVTSGTANSALSFRWFQDWIRERDGEFRTALENDDLMLNRFCQYLGKQGYPPESVAVLSEDETAYGTIGQKPGCSEAFIRLYYPRDIATLRSAYEQQSILSSVKPESSANAPSTTLRADLTEPASTTRCAVMAAS